MSFYSFINTIIIQNITVSTNSRYHAIRYTMQVPLYCTDCTGNMRKSEMSINFKSIKVWNKLPADICTADSLNVFMDNLRNYTSSHDTELITDVFFVFCIFFCAICCISM